VEVLLTRLLRLLELLQVLIPDMIWWMPHYILTIVRQVLLVEEAYLHIGIGRLVVVRGLVILKYECH
jgi:hypothetical protein